MRSSRRRSVCALVCWGILLGASSVSSQVLLDRVVARVGGIPVTLSDVRAGIGMGLIVAPEGDLDLAVEQWIQRMLLLQEVERFPPPEPDEAAVDLEEARIRMRIGSGFASLAQRTGLDDRQIRQQARGTLRVRAYLGQRFGDAVQVSDEEVRAYYEAHPEEFRRDGAIAPFAQVEASVRQAASAARLQGTIEQWMGELRQRAEVILTPDQPPRP